MPITSVLHILRTIKDRGTISRTDLQQITGLSWGTITNTTRELLTRKLIREEGALSTRAGRKPMQLALNPATHSLVGVQITPECVQSLVMNLAGEALWHEKVSNMPAEDAAAILLRTADMIRHALASGGLASRLCMGIGVAVPGVLDVGEGIVRSAPQMQGWHDVPVRELLETRLNAAGGIRGLIGAVRVENNSNCLAAAERWFGDAGHAEDLLCIHLGESIELGVTIAGDIFRGSEGVAGAFGHVTIDPQGAACACGGLGCVAAYCSMGSLVAHARSVAPAGDAAAVVNTIEELSALATAHNSAAVQTFSRMGQHLGIGVANLIQLFNPAQVVLAGRCTAAQAHFMPALEKEVAKVWPADSDRKVAVSHLGERAAAMGACGMILQAAFENEMMERAASMPA